MKTPRNKAQHLKSCQCGPCVNAKVVAYLDRVRDTSRLTPENAGQTVPVRAHWRRCPGHLRKQPKVRDALQAALATLLKQVKR